MAGALFYWDRLMQHNWPSGHNYLCQKFFLIRDWYLFIELTFDFRLTNTDIFCSDESDSANKKRQKRGGRGNVKAKQKKEPDIVKLARIPRGKRKFVTRVTGLATFGKITLCFVGFYVFTITIWVFCEKWSRKNRKNIRLLSNVFCFLSTDFFRINKTLHKISLTTFYKCICCCDILQI